MKKLHIGSGTWYAQGWVNVDVAVEPGVVVDVNASVFDLPFEPDTFNKIYMGHFLEHFGIDEIPEVMRCLRAVSTRDTQMAIVGPCMDLAVATNQPAWLLDSIREHGERPWGHQWTATGQKTKAILENIGLAVQTVHISDIHFPEWCNVNSSAEWQFALLAQWTE